MSVTSDHAQQRNIPSGHLIRRSTRHDNAIIQAQLRRLFQDATLNERPGRPATGDGPAARAEV